ncbi:MAG: prepilin-type N-terminal cleavage/methylation domain-containing protein, partial [Deltaproteobacteria bacterium]|nr:prepilin-type N-terminal cleavage/methylation domain-containing protein [Deltaproteobacteria bacterium]
MNRKGFTLLELMVILGIFAILATIAIPGFNAWIPN